MRHRHTDPQSQLHHPSRTLFSSSASSLPSTAGERLPCSHATKSLSLASSPGQFTALSSSTSAGAAGVSGSKGTARIVSSSTTPISPFADYSQHRFASSATATEALGCGRNPMLRPVPDNCISPAAAAASQPPLSPSSFLPPPHSSPLLSDFSTPSSTTRSSPLSSMKSVSIRPRHRHTLTTYSGALHLSSPSYSGKPEGVRAERWRNVRRLAVRLRAAGECLLLLLTPHLTLSLSDSCAPLFESERKSIASLGRI